MKRPFRIQSHLVLVVFACFALVGATAYFLELTPRPDTHPGTPKSATADADRFAVLAPWATAFAAQCFAFVAFVCPVAAHALSGRWSWSVRLLTAVSAYVAIGMAMMAVNAYEDMSKAGGLIRTPAELLEGALTLAAILVCYLLLVTCTFVWIATRGRRFRVEDVTAR